ncbi:AAA family ATPase [Paenirhodobacter sp. CAU 1674]|uniref:AAA family ATPase n=1 Tax=Paenirhodobacter sp. CAU 1674 TaxID=3032596 RepID=UPI0023DA2639|nr:AAA family ATPase [Paenirhodobacter sp. CAU 1674]MDF2141219.1 AAA family ATPase [Paenirhodobacter sp. CAU 1674]
MRPNFVETSNVRAFYGALKKVNERGAEEACLVVVDGKPGLGKTTTINRWCAQTGSVYLRAQKGWDYSWFVQEMLAELGVDPESIRGRRNRFARVLAELGDRAERAALRDQTFGIVIDECDLISARGEIMEGIRGISDLKFLPTILIGMGSLRDNLRKFPQIESRSPNKVLFAQATLEDARALIEGRCEVPVAPDLVNYVWKASRGFNREILDAIAHIERFGMRVDIDQTGVSIDDMIGQPIMTDRVTGKEIFVTGVL